MSPVIKQEHPQGMVLVFTLGILALLAILGTTIFLATKDEVQMANENTTSRDSFHKGDFSAILAASLAHMQIKGQSAGTLDDALKPGGVSGRPGFVVKVNNFTYDGFMQLQYQNTADLVKQQYLMATDSSTSLRPHVEVFYEYDGNPDRRQLIGTAAVGLGLPDPKGIGSQGQFTEPGFSNEFIFLVISADGRIPTRGRDDTTVPEDPSNYYTGDKEAKHSIITTVYRMLL